jgi:hypothetical protein
MSDRNPQVTTNHSKWNRENGLRITVKTLHDGFKTGRMFSVEHARGLASKLNQACDDVESEHGSAKQLYLDMGRKLGFID